MYDVVIVGGGPAGLSAALVLGRCRRRVLVCDTGSPRNARAQELHGYLSRDCIAPLDLVRAGRGELQPYGVELRDVRVSAITVAPEGFAVTLTDELEQRREPLRSAAIVNTRTVLIASGVADTLPDIPGFDECYGVTAHHCPYCDGWEERGKAIAVIGNGSGGTALALSLRTWSDRVTLCPNGRARLRPAHRAQLAAHGIEVHEGRITSIEHERGHVRYLALGSRHRLSCDAIFFAGGQHPQSDLPRQLGCELTKHGLVKTDHLGLTCVPGLYVAGDASRDVQFAIVAAAEGAKAAVAINKALQARAGLAVAQPQTPVYDHTSEAHRSSSAT
jgi:thioredoxin reductase